MKWYVWLGFALAGLAAAGVAALSQRYEIGALGLAAVLIGALLVRKKEGARSTIRERVVVPGLVIFVGGSLLWATVAVLLLHVTTLSEGLKIATTAGTVLSFGLLVGVAELVGRYRDEPWLALKTSPALLYCLLNGFVSLATLALVRKHPEWLPGGPAGLIVSGLASGFGAMMVLRSKILTVTLGDGKDYSVGPALVVEVLLRTLDRAVDRARATHRLALIQEKLKAIDLTGRALADFIPFFQAHLAGFQALTKEEKDQLGAIIQQIEDQQWPPSLALSAVAYAWLNIGGERYMNDLLAALPGHLQKP